MKSIKPWLSFPDQLDRLQARGMVVENPNAALDYLERVGYYRLSGYWYSLRAIDEAASNAQGKAVRHDHFINGSRFEDVIKLYVFDKKLRLLALDALERIEMAVRVDIAHLLGEYDPCAHIKPDLLHGNFTKKLIKKGNNKGKTLHHVWLRKYESSVSRARRDPLVSHHQQQYNELPIWVAIEIWDFGMLSHLFAGMKYADQAQIAKIYGASDGPTLSKWLRSLNFMRNVSAHHSRLWNINVLEVSPTPADLPLAVQNSRPFLYFCLMQKLLNVICPNSSWGERFKQLLNEDFPKNEHLTISLKDMGIVEGWEDWGLWNFEGHK